MKEKILKFVKDLHTRYKFTAKYGEYESVEDKLYFIEVDEYLDNDPEYCKETLAFCFDNHEQGIVVIFTSESENLYHDEITNWEII